METSWIIKLKNNSQVDILRNARHISTQITKACLLQGRDIIKIPTKLLNEIDVLEFSEYYDIIFENEITDIFLYRSNVFDETHFIQKDKNNNIVGSGIKFTKDLFENEELIKTERMCGKLILVK
jgi:hypothetical protein